MEGEEPPHPKDPAVEAMLTATEEGKKVGRSGSKKHYCVYRRIPDGEIPQVTEESFWGGGIANSAPSGN
jgi:hypothetical protein